MAKKSNLLRNLFTKKENSKQDGWLIGINMLSIDVDLACNKLRGAGVTVYRDKDYIWGLEEETRKAIQILADNGDSTSKAIMANPEIKPKG